jgi:outer membrane protein assembly factor BamB
VIKKKIIIILLLFLNQCSFDTKSGFWKEKEIKKEANREELFSTTKVSEFEVNRDLQIDINSLASIKYNFTANLTNNDGRSNYDGNLKKASKYKFSKINNFEEYELEVVTEKDNLIFFADNGTILKFDVNSKLIWKKNFYTKSEKKNNPILFFAKNENILIVTDNVAKYYALDINSGSLLWSKNHSSAFNSEVKIADNKIFVIDYDNILRCFSIIDGKEIWKIKTENSILKSQKKLSLVISKNQVIFNNSLGDITSVDRETGNLLWIVPTLSNSNSLQAYYLKISSLVLNNNNLFLSNNNNEFYSIDVKNGIVDWTQKINSNLKPIILGKIILTVSNEGFLVVLNSKNGEIIRQTDLFYGMKSKKRKKINPTGFIVGKNKIYVTTNIGRIFVVDIKDGQTIHKIKIDNNYISRPYVFNESLLIIRDDGIVKIN